MDMVNERQIIVIGLPSSGKTSFLAALQDYIDSDISGKTIQMFKYSDNSEYLNKIHSRWLNCDEPIRTNQDQAIRDQVLMFLEEIKTGDRLCLNVPDVAGEHFSQQWSDSYWEYNYKKLVDVADAILLFIHPDLLVTHASISDVYLALPGFVENDGNAEVSGENLNSWTPNSSPTQVVLADVLQLHLEHIFKQAPIPISIIISAWDTVIGKTPDLTPIEWLKINMPLLGQFLETNVELLTYQVFGVSAQGGDFSVPEKKLELQEKETPSERIIVQTDNQKNHDIGGPIISIIEKWRTNLR